MRRLLAEGIGTFVLVLPGTGAIVVDTSSSGAIGHVGVALCFGLVVLAMIQTFGEVSGAHLNPAVTIGFVVAGRFPLRSAAPYAAARCVAPVAGALLAVPACRLVQAPGCCGDAKDEGACP